MMYEYKCKNCQHDFMQILDIADRKKPLFQSCPECSKKGCVERVYSAPSIGDSEMLKADKRMESSGVQGALERIRDNVSSKMIWKG